jgi:tetratricopeptide (TPR) repeat protein
MRSQKPEARSQNGKTTRTGRLRSWSFFFWLLASGFWLLLPGCAASKVERQADMAVQDYLAGDYDRARKRLEPLAQKTDENYVLNNVRLGSTALAQYDLDAAEAAFLRAYEVLNSAGVNDPGRQAGAVWIDEKIRIWRGEPYERAMVNFYLGLVYYMRHDYGNARAAFENALFKLRDYGEGKEKADQYRNVESNFALAYLMLGRTWQKLGDEANARREFERAVELRKFLAPSADFDRNARANLLLVVDYGYGPQKMKNFDGAIVGFGPLPEQEGPVPAPHVVIDGRPYDLQGADSPGVDLLALAQDRKWQSLDTIRTLKSAIGTGLLGVGTYQVAAGEHNKTQGVGLGLIAAGLLLKATSQADVRQWEMVPRSTFVLPLEVAPGTHDVIVEFPGSHQTWRGLVVPAKGEATYYFRMQKYNSGPYNWPPPAYAVTHGR